MLPLGHTASSFILAESTRLIGYDPTTREVLLTMAFGNLLDVDFFIGTFFGRHGDSHHDYFTHTPLFAVVLWTFFILAAGSSLSPTLRVLLLLSLLLHLAFDEISHRLAMLTGKKSHKRTEINWFFPLKPFTRSQKVVTHDRQLLSYITRAPLSVLLEIVFTALALYLFLN